MVNINKKIVYFTTSWDDGSVLDLKIINLLNKYGIKGTFYIPRDFPARHGKFSNYSRRLSEEEIKNISEAQEVGAHSLSHTPLSLLSRDKIKEEIAGSKTFLQEICGKNIEMFCFPQGIYNEEIVNEVKVAGYLGSRTVKKLEFNLPIDYYEMGATLHCSPFPFRKKDSHGYYWRRILDPIFGYGFKLLFFPFFYKSYSWLSLAKNSLNYSLNKGSYFHLVGHSWEIDKYGLWDELESFLKYASSFSDLKFLTNSEVIKATSASQ